MNAAVQEKLKKREVMHTITDHLVQLHASIENDIAERLYSFSRVWSRGDEDELFMEMCFCVCTPQTNAKKGWAAASLLYEQNKFHSSQEEIGSILREAGVRFHKNKSRYIVKNREKFYGKVGQAIYDGLTYDDGMTLDDNIVGLRNKLAKDVSGWGLKEASHFLRNIGFGKHVCILDRHILRRLVEFNVIEEYPKILSASDYLSIEKKMKNFARENDIPIEALDLLFWYIAKGEIFK